jgi:VanZ family protein
MRPFLKYWLPVFIWLGVIFAGSTAIFSTEQTSRYLVPFLRWLDPQISISTIATIHLALRKLAHIGEYAVLAVLLWRALRSGATLHPRLLMLFIGVWLACAIFAVSDEFHQSFVASRSASPLDVMIDISGATFSLAICVMFAAWANRKSRIESQK